MAVSADPRGLEGLGLQALDGAILQPQRRGLGRGFGERGGAASLKPEAVFAASGSASGIHLSTDKQTNAQHQRKESSEPAAQSCPEKQGDRQRFWLLTK